VFYLAQEQRCLLHENAISEHTDKLNRIEYHITDTNKSLQYQSKKLDKIDTTLDKLSEHIHNTDISISSLSTKVKIIYTVFLTLLGVSITAIVSLLFKNFGG